MGYKDLENPVLTDINELCAKCGLFYGNTDLNSGYGCLAPECTNNIDHDNSCTCYDFNCPLASRASMADLKVFDLDSYNEYRENWEGNYNEKDEDNLLPQESFDVPMIQEREWVWDFKGQRKELITRLKQMDFEENGREIEFDSDDEEDLC